MSRDRRQFKWRQPYKDNDYRYLIENHLGNVPQLQPLLVNATNCISITKLSFFLRYNFEVKTNFVFGASLRRRWYNALFGELRNHQIYIITDHVSIFQRGGRTMRHKTNSATTVGNVKIVERYIKSNTNNNNIRWEEQDAEEDEEEERSRNMLMKRRDKNLVQHEWENETLQRSTPHSVVNTHTHTHTRHIEPDAERKSQRPASSSSVWWGAHCLGTLSSCPSLSPSLSFQPSKPNRWC